MGEVKEVSVDEVVDSAASGDTVNAAIFWREAYYARVPIAKLTVLASHIIVAAGRISPALIDGLEIVLCDSSGFRRLSREENEQWKEKAVKRDKKIGRIVLTP